MFFKCFQESYELFNIYFLGALRLQLVLNSLDESAKEDFQNGTNGAVVSTNMVVLFQGEEVCDTIGLM